MLNTVLTTSEGLDALEPLATSLVERFRSAGQPPPAALYTDRDCCRVGGGTSRLRELFGAWPQLIVRLDAWHFMRRFALGVTSASHPLYGTLMSRLSACLFEWDADDVALLERAKRAQLQADGVTEPTAKAVRLAITSKELSRHCRRPHRWSPGHSRPRRGAPTGARQCHRHPGDTSDEGGDEQHLRGAAAPSPLPAGPRGRRAIPAHRQLPVGRRRAAHLPLRPRHHGAGELPSAPLPLHPRPDIEINRSLWSYLLTLFFMLFSATGTSSFLFYSQYQSTIYP